MLGQSCDTLRSVESMKSDSTTSGRKQRIGQGHSRHGKTSTSVSKSGNNKSSKDSKRNSKNWREKVTVVEESLNNLKSTKGFGFN